MMLQSIWSFFVSIEMLLMNFVVGTCAVLSIANGAFLYAMIKKWKQSGRKQFRFESEFEWHNPDTLHIPFCFTLEVSNYYTIKLRLFNRGFTYRFKWFDVTNVELLDIPKRKEEKFVKLPVKPSKSAQKKRNQLERVSTLNSLLGTHETKTLLRKKHSVTLQK